MIGPLMYRSPGYANWSNPTRPPHAICKPSGVSAMFLYPTVRPSDTHSTLDSAYVAGTDLSAGQPADLCFRRHLANPVWTGRARTSRPTTGTTDGEHRQPHQCRHPVGRPGQ